MAGEPIRIGVLRDVPAPADNDFGGNSIRMVVEDVNEAGGIAGRPIELVSRDVRPTEAGTAENVEAAVAVWEELVHEGGVVGLIGPCTTPAVVAVHPLVESVGVPAIHWAGTDEACGDWHFQFQAGYLPDEGPALAYLLAHRGHERTACFRSEGAYGEAYLGPFIRAARASGIEVVDEIAVPVTATELHSAVERARSSGADALVAMGLFRVGVPLAEAIRAQSWEVACYGNCGFALGAAHNERARHALAGWIATDMFDPDNRTTQELLDRYSRRFGTRPSSSSPCFGQDLATLMVEGLRRAPELSRSGLRQGLEAVRDIPSATGGAGTRMGYGPGDRVALKGPRIFVFSHIASDGLTLLPA